MRNKTALIWISLNVDVISCDSHLAELRNHGEVTYWHFNNQWIILWILFWVRGLTAKNNLKAPLLINLKLNLIPGHHKQTLGDKWWFLFSLRLYAWKVQICLLSRCFLERNVNTVIFNLSQIIEAFWLWVCSPMGTCGCWSLDWISLFSLVFCRVLCMNLPLNNPWNLNPTTIGERQKWRGGWRESPIRVPCERFSRIGNELLLSLSNDHHRHHLQSQRCGKSDR